METSQPHVRVVYYVRTQSPEAPVNTTLQRLERLAADGIVDDVRVGTWPAKIRLGDPFPHSTVVALFEEFDAWAKQWDVSICPPFAVETRTSEITGDTRDLLITPIQSLAVYVEGALMEVFPHSAGPTRDSPTYTVADALTLLEERDIQAFGGDHAAEMSLNQPRAAAQTPVDLDRCPACETSLQTSQGVSACPDCDWIGVVNGAQPDSPDRYPQDTSFSGGP